MATWEKKRNSDWRESLETQFGEWIVNRNRIYSTYCALKALIMVLRIFGRFGMITIPSVNPYNAARYFHGVWIHLRNLALHFRFPHCLSMLLLAATNCDVLPCLEPKNGKKSIPNTEISNGAPSTNRGPICYSIFVCLSQLSSSHIHRPLALHAHWWDNIEYLRLFASMSRHEFGKSMYKSVFMS